MQTAVEETRVDSFETVVVFELRNERYGIPISQTQDVHRMMPITTPPGLSSHALGIIQVRDKIATLIDLASVFGFEPQKPAADQNIILLDLGEKLNLAILVDKVFSGNESIKGLPMQEIPLLKPTDTKKFLGVVTIASKESSHLVTIVDIRKALLPEGASVA